MVLNSIAAESQPNVRPKLPKQFYRKVVGHVYPQINISGDAKVQLGDQYGKDEAASAVAEEDEDNGHKSRLSLQVACATIQLAQFAIKLATGSQLAVDDAMSIPFWREHLKAARGNLVALRSAIDAARYAAGWRHETGKKAKLNPGDQIGNEAAHQCSEAAEALVAALSQIEINQDHAYRDARTALESLRNVSLIDEMLSTLNSICWQSLLGPLMEVGKKKSAFQDLFGDFKLNTFEKHLLGCVEATWAQHNQKIRDLENTIASVWSGSQRRSVVIQAAMQWITVNKHLVRDCTETVFAKFSQENDNSIRRRLTASLRFDEVAHRYQGIVRAQVRTFDWLFEDSTTIHGSFARWLRDNNCADDRLYWVRGKPGSGKSTLMRYLSDDPRTRNMASIWSEGQPLIVVTSFFWAAGTVLQKSLQGLLQTILYQLLSQYTTFSKKILLPRWTMLDYGAEDGGRWSLEELREAIFAFVQLYGFDLKILFIVDGLDEFQGDDKQRQNVCDLLHELSQSNATKVCVSSRPWNIYENAFRSNPQLKLEELTRQDIYNFTEDGLYENSYFAEWSHAEPTKALNLIETVVERAKGVFLWVRLVVRSLVTGLQNGDNAYDMTRRLEEIPEELEEYFMLMMDRLEPFYLEQASHFFELALLGSYLVMDYYFFQETVEPTENQKWLGKPFDQEDVQHHQGQQERRIKARCKDLLEFQISDRGQGVVLNTVEFLHRTARDFVASPEIQAKLMSWRKTDFNLQQALLEAYTCLLQTCRGHTPWLANVHKAEYVEQIARMLKHVHLSTSNIQLLASAEKNFDKSLSRAPRRAYVARNPENLREEVGTYYYNPDFLGLVITKDGYKYVLARLRDFSADDLKSRPGRPLLDYALNAETSELKSPSIEVVARLLELGADPQEMRDDFPEFPTWGRYFATLAAFKPLEPEKLSVHTAVAELLLSTGISNAIRSGGGDSISKSRLRTLVQEAFPPDIAVRLNETLTKTLRKEMYKSKWRSLKQVVS